MKETILKISNPMPKVKVQTEESELPSSSTPAQETAIIEELPSPEPEQTDTVEPKNVKYATTYHSGWKASDILREIRLDSFGMGSVD